jgi:alpha-L-fucosidase
VNGEAIYGTTASPFPLGVPWGRVTKKIEDGNTTLYLHVFENFWPKDGKLVVPGLKNKIVSASLLNGHKKLKAANDASGVTISIPSTAPDKFSSTIVLKIKGTPEIN